MHKCESGFYTGYTEIVRAWQQRVQSSESFAMALWIFRPPGQVGGFTPKLHRHFPDQWMRREKGSVKYCSSSDYRKPKEGQREKSPFLLPFPCWGPYYFWTACLWVLASNIYRSRADLQGRLYQDLGDQYSQLLPNQWGRAKMPRSQQLSSNLFSLSWKPGAFPPPEKWPAQQHLFHSSATGD